jgi:large subunit ribosomal protein L31
MDLKPDIHPPYGPVAFRDRSTGTLFLTGSTVVSRRRYAVASR